MVFLNFVKVNLFTLMTQGRDHGRESPLAQKKHCEFHSHVCLIAVHHHIDQFIVCFIYSHAVIKFQWTDLLYTIQVTYPNFSYSNLHWTRIMIFIAFCCALNGKYLFCMYWFIYPVIWTPSLVPVQALGGRRLLNTPWSRVWINDFLNSIVEMKKYTVIVDILQYN